MCQKDINLDGYEPRLNGNLTPTFKTGILKLAWREKCQI
jgi:hypothetical protein